MNRLISSAKSGTTLNFILRLTKIVLGMVAEYGMPADRQFKNLMRTSASDGAIKIIRGTEKQIG